MAAPAGPDPQRRPDLALFDFDGTITTRETFPDFIRLAIPGRRKLAGAVLFAPLVAGYRLGLVPVGWLRAALVRYAFRGVARRDLALAGRRFAAEVLPPLVRPRMQDRIDWHLGRGDTVVVVSGGFDVYLGPWCEARGIAWICSSMAVHGDRLTGRYAGAQCVAAEKVRRVRERYDLSAYAAVHAYGDTHEDHALLALAHHATYRGRPWPGPAAAAGCAVPAADTAAGC